MCRSILLLTCWLAAATSCGDSPVKAINLASGKTADFASEQAIPGGWAACQDPSCETIADSIPCPNLGETVCELRPGCRLATAAAGSMPAPMPGTDATPTAPPPPPASCIPAEQTRCDEFAAEVPCNATSGCSWQQTCAPPSPNGIPGQSCSISCVAAAPASCESLAERDCLGRQDCSWNPQPCPSTPTPGWGGGTPDATCQPFCQIAATRCPTLVPPPKDFCGSAPPLPRYDAEGCVIGFDCASVCPVVAEPDCGLNSTALAKYDPNGCLIGYTCSTTATSCQALTDAYRKALKQAKACTVGTLTQSCGELMPSALQCPCPTPVNSENPAALAELRRLQQEFSLGGCDKDVVCPAIGCAVSRSTCAAVGGIGQCIDGN